MTAPTPPAPEVPTVKRRQMNVRLPEDLIAQVDLRRARKDLSRDAWVERAIRYALANSPTPRPRQR